MRSRMTRTTYCTYEQPSKTHLGTHGMSNTVWTVGGLGEFAIQPDPAATRPLSPAPPAVPTYADAPTTHFTDLP